MNGIRFRTQARTIDHLGQSQIADCPTAISELWKNAYDAYARDVALHIFEGERPMAAIVDNGHGMSPDEFVERWMVVGTESKASSKETPEEDRFGLPPRVAQGQKGIGRLSVAYLGPLVLVISKRRNRDFVASLIDWRVFENPYLLLDDIIIPVETFSDKKEFSAAFGRMQTLLSENVWPVAGEGERRERLTGAWKRYDDDLLKSDKNRLSEEIAESVMAFDALTEHKLKSWPVWSGKSPCGTALFVLDVRRELSVWVDPSAPSEDDEVKAAKSLLEETLIAFVDPNIGESRQRFRYEVVVHSGGVEKRPIHWDDTIPIEEVRELEHVIEGVIDEYGVFKGTVRVFGQDLGTVVLPPQRRAPATAAAYVGNYKILAATYEQVAKASAMTLERYAWWEARIERHGGFAIYRDELRVLPYGRVAGDMFEIDVRRSKNAGREFWAYRRIIGRISISRKGNPNLIDKAGREGLKDNQARREFKIRVIDLLKTVARRYFGSENPNRAEKILDNEQRHKDALKNASKRSRRQFRAELKDKEPKLQASMKAVEQALLVVQAIKEQPAAARTFEDVVGALRRNKAELAIGQPPRNLDGEDEERYRAYRDSHRTYREKVDALYDSWTQAVSKAEGIDPIALANRKLEEHRNDLAQAVHAWRRDIHTRLDGEKARASAWDKEDAAKYGELTSGLLVDLAQNSVSLPTVLSRLEVERETLRQEFTAKYEAYLRALDRLIEGVDVEGALRWSSEEIDVLKQRVGQVHALAQLGVTVEIVGHEFETLDAEVRRGLSRLPREVQATDAFHLAKQSHLALVQKLRFLTPLKLSGMRLRDKVRGKEIAKYMRDFFGERLTGTRTEFSSTGAFDRIIVTEFRSRLYPVFINLINNALYWLTFAEHARRIVLDCVDDAVVVADSGRGVDPDDLSRLFELFFTRRVDGRGVGLYLCRENLGAGGHTIEYADAPEHRVLPGANFVIRFRGMEHG